MHNAFHILYLCKKFVRGNKKNVFVDERKKAIRSFWLISDYLPDGATRRVTVARDILTNDDHYARTASGVCTV